MPYFLPEPVFDQALKVTLATLRSFYDALRKCFPNGHVRGHALTGAFDVAMIERN